MIKGIVYYRNIINAIFVIELDSGGYTVFECYNINSFNVADQVSGALSNPGTTVILNASTLKPETVNILETDLSLTKAMNLADLKSD